MSFGYDTAKALKVMRWEKKVYKDYVPDEAIDVGMKLVHSTGELWEDVKKTVMELIKEEIPYEYPHVAVWWYSVLLGMKKDPLVFKRFFQYVKQNKNAFSINTQYFLWYQLRSLLFHFPELNLPDSRKEVWKFRMEITEEFAGKITTPLDRIPEEKRDEDLVLVITEQFLSIQHGPTKTALDRCKALMTKMGKRVLLINTGEVLTSVGKIPFYGAMAGNYMEEKLSEKKQEWKGVSIPYYQCQDHMPDIEKMNQLLWEIRNMAPGSVVAIGGGGMLGDLAGKLVPVLAVGLSPSDLVYTCAQYQTLSRKLTESDIGILKELGYTEKHVIESIFTSSLKPQTEHITKETLGVLDHKFLMIVVGARLDEEVTDEFLEMLEEIIEADMFVGFLGIFKSFEKRRDKFSKLREQSAYFGFCSDILSRMEVCDLYVNPIRMGGGTSCVEAMYQGVPIVTTDYGDVAVNAGDVFCVKDYREMQDKILRYYREKDYYQVMSEKARERAEILLDTETEFARIMEEMNQREKERIQENDHAGI